MRLHALRLRAVGPFADPQEIDFDRLGAGGLFLFEGPTGVGKTTIIDALTFALYGGLASDAGDTARMRSDFVDPETRPEVELEFSVRGQRHRITRSPEYLRPKRRGSGTTRERASVHLQRYEGGSWVSRSHAKDEVGTLVGEMIGLNREQFRQVVLLPQGEFATFLRATDDERRDVLAKLFGTHFFQRVANDLQARAQAAVRALQSADAELGRCVAAALEAAGTDPARGAEVAALPLAQRLDALAAVGQGVAAQAASASAAAEAAERAELAARSAGEAAQALVARLEHRARVEASLDAALREGPEQEQRRARLDRARRAAPVRPILDLADRAGVAVAELRDAVVRAGSSATEHLEGLGGAQLTATARDVRRTADSLAPLVQLESSLLDRRAQHAVDRAQLVGLEESLATVTQRVVRLPGEIAEARARLEEAQEAGSRLPGLLAQQESVRAHVSAAERVAVLEGELLGLGDALRTARHQLNGATDEHDLLVHQRLADLRGELAARLLSGDPCLVCGSPEHPAPAEHRDAGVSEQQIREAAARRDDAHVRKDSAEAAVIRAQADLEHARATAGELSVAQGHARLVELGAQLASATALEAGLAQAQSRVAALAEQQEQSSRAQVELTRRVAASSAESDQRLRVLEEDAATIEQARDGHGTVAGRVADLVASAGRHEALAAAVEALSGGMAAHGRAVAAATDEAVAAGFGGLDEAREAVLAEEAIERLRHLVDEWEERVRGARTQLAEPELADLVGVDVDAAHRALEQAQADLAAAVAATAQAREGAGVAVRQRERFADRLAEVQAAAAQRGSLAAEGEEVVALDQYARGMAGSPRMSLVTFVLRYWFEQVVAAANVRLAVMSSGKYELLRIDEGARRDARVGLGLAVLDRHTGRERSPGTLSGGETFYTSLALALGLADVVIAQAGGAQLDTLFIDEGFGSLDPDTLDDVMAVIDELRGHGRVVGIVSHVPELKERIPERLSVRRVRADGPSTVVVRA